MEESDRLVRDLYIEAAAACGDDVHAIERFVDMRVAAMSAEDRHRVRRIADRVVRFQSPAKRPAHEH